MFMVSPRTAQEVGGSVIASRASPGCLIAPARPHVVRTGPRRRWCADRAAALAQASRSGADRWAARRGALHRARRAGALSDQRLSHIDRVTGEPLRRYEHPYPGSLLHVDVTKFGNIPDGGGHRFVGRQQGDRNRAATARPNASTGQRYKPRSAHAYLHTVIDDHSRVAYVEICADEKAADRDRCPAASRRPGSPTAASASSASSPTTAPATAPTPGATPAPLLGITHKRTRPYRPQTNGKIERFHRTLADGWAYARLYASEPNARDALPVWIHFYNHHRIHSAIGGTPISRLNNLPGHHT